MVTDDSVSELAQWIVSNINSNPSVGDVALRFGYSKGYTHLMFKKYIGGTISAFIKNKHMVNAIIALVITDMTIMEIAVMNGFSSNATFTRKFKTTFGFPPCVIRKPAFRFLLKQYLPECSCGDYLTSIMI